MMRHFIILALLGLALVPDWASALGGRRLCLPPPPPPCPPPMVFVPPCLPTFSVAPPSGTYQPTYPTPNYSIIPAPRVEAEPGPAEPAPAKPDAPKADPAPAAPRPVAPGVPPGSAAEPKRGDAVKPADFAKPEVASPSPPKPAPKSTEEPKKLDVSQIPGTGSDKDDDAKIPPLVPRLPNPDAPPFNIPQLPLEPRGKTSTSKSSPLTDTPRVDVFPVDGTPPASPKDRRSVGFFNHTDRELKLTVDGETIALPKRSFVAASLPATFTWKLDGGEERRTAIPATAPGVEVVIRK